MTARKQSPVTAASRKVLERGSSGFTVSRLGNRAMRRTPASNIRKSSGLEKMLEMLNSFKGFLVWLLDF